MRSVFILELTAPHPLASSSISTETSRRRRRSRLLDIKIKDADASNVLLLLEERRATDCAKLKVLKREAENP